MLGKGGRRASQKSHSDKRREKEICDEIRQRKVEMGMAKSSKLLVHFFFSFFLFFSLLRLCLVFSSVLFTAPLFFIWVCNRIGREQEWIYTRGLKLKFWEREEDDRGRWFRTGYGRLWFVTGVLIFISDKKCMWRGREGSWPLICCVIDSNCFM